MFSRSIIHNTKSIIDDSRVMLKLVASLTIIIFLIVQATKLKMTIYNSRSIIDDSRVTLKLVASFTIIIFL